MKCKVHYRFHGFEMAFNSINNKNSWITYPLKAPNKTSIKQLFYHIENYLIKYLLGGMAFRRQLDNVFIELSQNYHFFVKSNVSILK